MRYLLAVMALLASTLSLPAAQERFDDVQPPPQFILTCRTLEAVDDLVERLNGQFGTHDVEQWVQSPVFRGTPCGYRLLDAVSNFAVVKNYGLRRQGASLYESLAVFVEYKDGRKVYLFFNKRVGRGA